MSNMQKTTLNNRHDFLFLFEVANGNPNGDPDAGNTPRLNPNTNKGIVTDVCLKRKVRNFVELLQKVQNTKAKEFANNYNLLIRQGAVIEEAQEIAEKAATEKGNPAQLEGNEPAEKAKNWLCRQYYDVRTFGGVLSTGKGVMKGSAFGQIRGPVQFTFAQSLHPITPLEITITRCAITAKKDAGEKESTMGRKHIVPYALYAARGYVSPAFAANTGFTQTDLDILFDALLHMFEQDRSSARGEMIVRGLYDFEHVGTQPDTNPEQNTREAQLGCAHAHELFNGIKIRLRDGKEIPESFDDYVIENTWTPENLPKGIKLHLRHK
jgi:CRISPR-associated protein Csd2